MAATRKACKFVHTYLTVWMGVALFRGKNEALDIFQASKFGLGLPQVVFTWKRGISRYINSRFHMLQRTKVLFPLFLVRCSGRLCGLLSSCSTSRTRARRLSSTARLQVIKARSPSGSQDAQTAMARLEIRGSLGSRNVGIQVE